jgi:hypothetical protein
MRASSVRRPSSRKPERTFCCHRYAHDIRFVTIKQVSRGKWTARTYTVRPISGSPAVSVTFAKHGTGDIYDVHFDPATGWKQCCCKSFESRGWCCHSDCCEALWTRGLLSD